MGYGCSIVLNIMFQILLVILTLRLRQITLTLTGHNSMGSPIIGNLAIRSDAVLIRSFDRIYLTAIFISTYLKCFTGCGHDNWDTGAPPSSSGRIYHQNDKENSS
jgi:hypothetical protein